MQSRTVRSCLALALSTGMSIGHSGCRVAPEAQAPEIPPASTFVMDFSGFEDGAEGEKRRQDAGGKAFDLDPRAAQLGLENWGFAALNVGVWNVIITVGLAVPVAAFYESFNHDAELLEDGTFVWSYDFHVAAIRHTAELHGRIVGNNVEWDMFISREGEYDDFNWYSGVSTLTRSEGTWTLNKDPQASQPFIDIVWHRDPEAELGDIRYTNVEPDAPQNGSYIAYETSDAEPYNASYTIYGAQDGTLIEIEWNRTTHAGRVRAPHHFEDEAWHCWDENRQNAECPEE